MLDAVKQKHGRYLSLIPKLVVGVSGGADSLALLHMLKALLGGARLVVAHLDHGWREASREEAQFVRETAVSWGIPFHGKRLASSNKQSGLEAAGRQARYQFFAEVAQCENATHIAVGHNQNDQVETILHHLLRGSGLKGMSGMSFESPLPGRVAMWVIRPLLHISRDEIEAYCHQNQLNSRQDETNSDPQFLRNRLRHELLPLLKTYNEKINRHLLQLADILSGDDSFLEQFTQEKWLKLVVSQGDGWVTLSCQEWLNQPLSLQRRLLRTAVSNLNSKHSEVGFQSIEEARVGLLNGRFGQTFHLPAGITVTVQSDTLLFCLPDVAVDYDLPILSNGEVLTIDIPCTTALNNGWQIVATIIDQPDFNQLFAPEMAWEAYLPLVDGPLHVRPRVAGEKIRPLGMNGRSRKLKKVMSEHHIPQKLRDSWLLFTIQEEIVWVPGIIRAEPYKVQGDETKLIHLKLQKKQTPTI